MAIEEIKDKDYLVQYEPDSSTIDFKGELSLAGPTEYAPITQLLDRAADSLPQTLTLNLRELAFLNSSGISMLSKFVLSLRKKKGIQLVILGSNDKAWQGKSLKSLERLLPGLKLEIK